MPHNLTIRFAIVEDVPTILNFVKALADYEKLSHEVVATEEDLKKTLFGDPANFGRQAEVIIASDESGEDIGFALFFHNYSTFLGKHGIWLEDLFVHPDARGKGAGKALLKELAKIAKDRGCGRLEWWVLDWNTPSIDFYKSLGAKPMDEWTVFRLTGSELTDLAES